VTCDRIRGCWSQGPVKRRLVGQAVATEPANAASHVHPEVSRQQRAARKTGRESDPSGAAPELLWPARLVLPGQRTVYLDLNHWIALSQAATGHREGVQYSDTLDACKAAAQAGVLFPISSVSYIEVSKIKDPRQRARLAEVMEELSGFRTVASHSLIVTMKLDAAISGRLGVPSRARQDLAYLGSGVGYAFGQVLTPTFSGLPDDEHTRQVAAVYGPDLLQDLMLGFERFALRGPANDEAADMRRTGWDPEAAWKIAIERANEERGQAALFEAVRSGVARTAEEQLAVDSTDRKDWRKGRLRDAIAVRELTKCIWDLFGDVLSWYGRPTIEQLWGDERHQGRAFIRQMPSSEVAIELKTALHKDAARAVRWLPNDVTDIDQLAMAVPYCDVVVRSSPRSWCVRRSPHDPVM